MKPRELIKLLEENGWYEINKGKGSHRHFKHDGRVNKITVPFHI